MSYGERTRNPHEATEQVDDNPILCRGCGDYLGDADAPTPIQPVHPFNGWPWCGECIKTVKPVQAELERASKAGVERDDFIDQVRR